MATLRSKRVSFPVKMDDAEEMNQSDEEEEEEQMLSFNEMGLDNKIIHAIASFGWNRPTLIQEKTIPLALEGEYKLLFMLISRQ